ncbi:unnamed protein product [Pleuronectes platessa]|uniref:Uncharacterized protein n=1 Tax=Pleuronectes platessa TaxID=8262 RepID=A0A9N7ZD57_PLEPL|nr:unnamed protein product [Pleuronectes platessa]
MRRFCPFSEGAPQGEEHGLVWEVNAALEAMRTEMLSGRRRSEEPVVSCLLTERRLEEEDEEEEEEDNGATLHWCALINHCPLTHHGWRGILCLCVEPCVLDGPRRSDA